MAHPRWRSLLAWLLSGGLAIGLLAILYFSAPKYAALIELSTPSVLMIAGLTLLGLVLNGVVNRVLVQALGTPMSTVDSFLISSMSSLANQLPVSGGIVARGVYLRSRHRLPYARFLSSTVALFVCFVSANGIVGLGVLSYWALFLGRVAPLALFAVFIAMTCAILVFALPLGGVKLPQWISSALAEARIGWSLVGRKPRIVAAIVVLQMVLLLCLAWRYWLAFRMLSQDVSISEATLFSAVAVLTQLVSVAPGGLGVTEGIVGGIASLLGFQLAVSVGAVALDRLISTVIILVVGGASALLIGRQMLNDRRKDEPPQ